MSNQELEERQQHLEEIRQQVMHLPDSDLFRMNFHRADILCKTKCLPKHFQNNPVALLFAMEKARELDMPWTWACQVLYPTPAGIGMEAKAMRALLLRRNCKLEYEIDEPEEVVCRITRPDGQSYASRWTVKRASNTMVWSNRELISLLSKWERHNQNIQNMLRQRASSEAAREIAPDMIGGMYIRDEIEDIEEQHGQIPPEEKIEHYEKQKEEHVRMTEVLEQEAINRMHDLGKQFGRSSWDVSRDLQRVADSEDPQAELKALETLYENKIDQKLSSKDDSLEGQLKESIAHVKREPAWKKAKQEAEGQYQATDDDLPW